MGRTHYVLFWADEAVVKSMKNDLKTGDKFSLRVSPNETSARCLWSDDKLTFHFQFPDKVSTTENEAIGVMITARFYHDGKQLNSFEDFARKLEGEEQDIQLRVDNKMRKALLDFELDPEPST